MKITKSYRRVGTPDLPVASYSIRAGVDMRRMSHYHEATEIILVRSGTETMQIGSVRTVFSAGDIYIIPSNTVHSRLDYSPDAAIRSVLFFPASISLTPEHFFQQEFVTPLAEGRLVMPPVLKPDHPAYEAVTQQIRQIGKHTIYREGFKLGRFSAIMNICMALMPYCQVTQGEAPISDPGNEVVKLCMRYIHNHYYRKFTLEDIAQHCHLHPNYLCALFKSYTGQTIFEYLNRYRIEVAMDLLCKEDLPVSRVAELIGFHSESLFYQKFKEFTGKTPKSYRKEKQTESR